MSSFPVSMDLNSMVLPLDTQSPTDSSKVIPLEISELLKVFHSSRLTKDDKKLIETADKINLQEAIDAYVLELSQLAQKTDPVKALHRLAEMLPLEKLQDAVRTKFPNHKDALETAKGMMKKAQYCLHNSERDIGAQIKGKFNALLDTIITFLESLITAFGIADFFTPAENDMQANAKFQRIMTLISFFMMLTSTLLPLLGVATGGIFVGAALLAICVISVVYQYIKPMPPYLPKARNWTKEYIEGDLVITGGREDAVKKLAKALIAHEQSNRHPLLIGKSGIGKTQTVQALVAAIERGDFPELKGKKVFYFNTADLLSGNGSYGGDTKVLKKISDAMGRHRDNIILVFDEIHKACVKRDGSDLCGQLLTLLDKGKENFPYFIGITTEKEYRQYIVDKQTAFHRRFKRIPIEDTKREDTLRVLQNMIIQSPGTLVADGALEYLYKKTSKKEFAGSPQPGTAVKILSECIIRTKEAQKSTLEEKIGKLRNKIERAELKGMESFGLGLLPTTNRKSEKIEKWQSQLKVSEEQLVKEQEGIAQLYKAKDLLIRIKDETLRTVLKVEHVKQDRLSKKDNTNLKSLLLLSHFLAPLLNDQIATQAPDYGLELVIDKNLIKSVISEELDNDRKTKELTEADKK